MTTLATQVDKTADIAPRETAHDKPQLTRLITVARQDARFCIRLADVSEVGRIVHLTEVNGPHESVVGSMVLHGQTLWVMDAAVAIGAIREVAAAPTMFAAARTSPPVCIAFDEIVGKYETERPTTKGHTHGLVDGLVPVSGLSMPIIDVEGAARLCDCTSRILKATSLDTQAEKEPVS